MKSFLKSIFCFFIVLAWAGMAYAVPVNYLPAVTPADAACDNAVNEKALLEALQNWVKKCNAELAKLEKMQEKELVLSLFNMDEEMPFANLLEADSKNTLDELAGSVLETWFKPEDTAKLSPAKQKVLALLGGYGLVPESEEGMTFLALDNAFFYKQLQLSPQAKALVDVIISQPLSSETFMREDGILNYGQNAFAKWAVSLEKFMRANPENPYAAEALQRYQLWIEYMLFYNLTDADGVLSNWQWQKDFLRDIAKEYPDTFTAGLIKAFTDSIEANGLKDQKALKQTIMKRIAAEFTFAAPKQNNNVNDSLQYYEGKGVINANIPVSLWFDIKNGIVSGEIIYTKTKKQIPIRLLGYIKENNSIELREMLSNGDVSGTISGKFVRGTITGIWQGRSKMIERQNGEYEYKEGKEFPLKITAAERKHSPYKWDFDSKKASGLYAYSLWENGDNGTVNLQIKDNGTVEYRIIGLTGAPGYRTASFPEEALFDEKAAVAAALKDNIISIDVDENCAIELTLYSDFLVSRYVEGKYCQFHVGNGATAEGLFLKTK